MPQFTAQVNAQVIVNKVLYYNAEIKKAKLAVANLSGQQTLLVLIVERS